MQKRKKKTHGVRRSLPRHLCISSEYAALSKQKQRSLTERLNQFSRLAEAILEWTKTRRSASQDDAWSFLDNLELDLWALQSYGADDKSEVSSWFVHSSWSFDIEAAKMLACLPPKVVSAIDSPVPSIDSSVPELIAWLRQQGLTIRTILRGLFASRSLSTFLAYFVALDIVASAILIASQKARLNPAITRPV
jgi:hypothetical protein